jgi:hypothetical protein
MTVSTLQLAEAREVVRSLLEELRLEAYLFEVEPRGAAWEIRVDCGINGQWQSLTLTAASGQLTASREDDAVREALLSSWREPLRACARSQPE